MPRPLDVRLPDIPNEGYSTKKQRELSDAEMFIIRGLERERPLLLQVVIEGASVWRKRFIKSYRCIGATEESADQVFRYLVLLAGPNPSEQQARLLMNQTQQRENSWDKRLRTMLRQAKDRKGLEMDIVRESLKARKTYSH